MIPRIKPPAAHSEIKQALAASERVTSNARSRFEGALASSIGARHVLAFNRGRDALVQLLAALDLPKGEGVGIPAVCCLAVSDAITMVGLKPVWLDCGINGSLSPHALRKAAKEGLKVAVVVHLNGMPAPLSEIMDICEENGIFLIEDCAQALGSEYANRRVGTFGNAAIFSFAFDKHLSLGLGGALATNDNDLVTTMQKLDTPTTSPQSEREILYGLALLEQRFHTDEYTGFIPVDEGIAIPLSTSLLGDVVTWLNESRSSHPKVTYTPQKPVSRLNRLLSRKKPKPPVATPQLMGNYRAYLGLLLLKQLPNQNMQRRFLASTWRDGLAGMKYFSRSAWDPDWFKPVPLRYTIFADPLARPRLIKHFTDLGVECGPFNWPTPLAPYPNASDFCRRIINLPNYPELDHDQILEVTEELRKVWH
jgi:dTDP-4-amino-4,6-dideoxygalactose transaminase